MTLCRAAVLVLGLLSVASPCFAMNNYDDPRVILSYMDKSLLGAQDILRVTTTISDDRLVFQVKTREQAQLPGENDYLLLQFWQNRSHQILIPLGAGRGDTVLSYVSDAGPDPTTHVLAPGELSNSSGSPSFTVRRIPRGVEFLVPVTWLDYSQELGFDAYTVRGKVGPTSFAIETIYDQAAKGHHGERFISPFMLLNKLCATRK